MRHIVTAPDSILLKVAKPVIEFDIELSTLIEDMIRLMFDFQGVGIAAPQVGESLRVIAFMPLIHETDYPMPPRVLINPVIYDNSKNYIEDTKHPRWIRSRVIVTVANTCNCHCNKVYTINGFPTFLMIEIYYANKVVHEKY